MNNLNKLVPTFILVFSILFFSCTKDNSDDPVDDGYVTADYIVENAAVADLTYGNNNLYLLYEDTSMSGGKTLNKIDESGRMTTLNNLNNDFLASTYVGVTFTDNNSIFCVAEGNISGDIFKYDLSTEQMSTYKITTLSPPFDNSIIKMTDIANYGDGTYVVFDNMNKCIRRYVPELNTDLVIVGSGNYDIVDGSGQNASFKKVTKLVAFNGIIYLIDDNYNLRKVEKSGNEFVATTLISNYSEKFQNLFTDSDGNVFVVIIGKGVYKLNLSSNTLEEYLMGSIKLKNADNSISIEHSYGKCYNFLINSNNLYFAIDGNVVKISDYKTKLF